MPKSVDFDTDKATLWWTVDDIFSIPKEHDYDRFRKSVWVKHKIHQNSIVIEENGITFKSESWGTGKREINFRLESDGRLRGTSPNPISSEDTTWEAVRADTGNAVILTGLYDQPGYASGVFIAVFPSGKRKRRKS